ncbi:hypothetical protein [Oscillatoria sp. HE19RPO]|uniref:hypothetical protein n=1 Tax=Oscillatoria sp. HE19RPO TaxID=2954806 RepID=UPI0020C26A3E|nr:hypothetical protein [Oscillatoria sp. HE19RPO]
MNPLSLEKFHQSLEVCKSLKTIQRQRSTLPCEALHLLCEVAQDPFELLDLCQQHDSEIEPALTAIADYAASVDNWKAGDCPFGVKDHCNILHFLLNVHTKQFAFFRGRETFTPEIICEFIKDWKGIDLTPLIASREKTSVA